MEVLEILRKQPPEMLYKKSIIKNFPKFTGKHLYQSLCFNKVAGRDSGEFCEISKNTFFTEHLLETASDFRRGEEEEHPEGHTEANNREIYKSQKQILIPKEFEKSLNVTNCQKVLKISKFSCQNFTRKTYHHISKTCQLYEQYKRR